MFLIVTGYRRAVPSVGTCVRGRDSSRGTQMQMSLSVFSKPHRTVRLNSQLANVHTRLWTLAQAADLLFWLLRKLN